MDIDRLIDDGQLDNALQALTEQVQKDPINFRRRSYLFSLLCFAGDYTRAEQQLAVLSQENSTTATGSEFFRMLVRATASREALFREGKAPPFLLGKPAYAEAYLAALQALGQGDDAAAAAHYAAAELQRPQRAALVGEVLVSDFRDADDRTAAFLELFVEGQYTWIALEQVMSLQVATPGQLRDLLWAPVRVVTAGQTIAGLMPVLYAGSIGASDGRVKLGHVTSWVSHPLGLALGQGQRLFTAGAEDFPLLEQRNITLLAEDAEQAPEAALQGASHAE